MDEAMRAKDGARLTLRAKVEYNQKCEENEEQVAKDRVIGVDDFSPGSPDAQTYGNMMIRSKDASAIR